MLPERTKSNFGLLPLFLPLTCQQVVNRCAESRRVKRATNRRTPKVRMPAVRIAS